MANYNPYIQNPYLYGNSYQQQYQQPQYQQNYQQMFPTQTANAYQQQLQQQPATISGRAVVKIEDIAANEVPMDGSMSYFPKLDGTEIYGKRWNADGTVSTVIYKAEMAQNAAETISKSNTIDTYFTEVNERFSELFDRVDELKQIVTPKQRKKEVLSDD